MGRYGVLHVAVGLSGVRGGVGGGREFRALGPGLPDCFDGVAGMGLDFFTAEEIVDCEGGCDLFIPVVCLPYIDGSSARRTGRGIIEICGRLALSLVCFAICVGDFDVEAIASVAGSAIALGAARAGGLGDCKLAGVEEKGIGVGGIEESLFLFKRSFLLVDEIDSSFADALFHGAVFFDRDGDGEFVLFLESVHFGLETILSKGCISICSLICIRGRVLFSSQELVD